ncbi:MAG: O-antigen ligase family protein [bacterium]
MNWLAKHILFFHVAALIIALGWIHGGTRPDWLLPVVPWLAFAILQWFLLCPQPKKEEFLLASRQRIWRAVTRDSLTYVSLAFTVLLVIPFFNITQVPTLNESTQHWQVFAPPVKWLPFTPDIRRHGVVLLWFIPAMITVLSVKHGLLKRTKRILLEVICWNGAALALLGFFQLAVKATSILGLTPLDDYFFSVFGYVNVGAAYFTLIGAVSFGLWLQQAAEEANLAAISTLESDEIQSKLVTHRMFIPMVLCFAGAIATLSRAAILLCSLLFVFFLIYGLAFIWKRIALGLRISILSGLSALIFSMIVLFFALKLEGLKKEISSITSSAVIERVLGTGQNHVSVSKKIIADYPIFGVGGWGYPVYQQAYMTPEEHKKMQVVGGSNVHNDMFQFLVEHGYVGFGLMMAFALLLVIPLVKEVVQFSRLKTPETERPGPQSNGHWFYRIPPVAIAVFAGTTATVLHSFGDLPFRSPAILVVWLVSIVCVSGWIPVMKKQM